MTRVHDWELRFVGVMEKLQLRQFDWTEFNCLHLGSAVVRAIRGDEYELPPIPVILSEADASEALAATKEETLGDFLLGLFEEVPVVMAQRGDLGVFGKSTVVCMGTYWFGISEAGSVRLDRARVQRAFRI